MSDETLDLQDFLQRVQDDRELLLELLDIFQADYQEKRKLLEAAVESKNFEEIRSIAHSLKGATGNISAKPLRETFLRIEELGKNGEESGIKDLLPALDDQYKDLSERIGQLKQELNG